MVMDYVKDTQQAEQSYIFSEELELTPFVANAKGEDLNSIPTFLKTPFKENSKSVLSKFTAHEMKRNFSRKQMMFLISICARNTFP